VEKDGRICLCGNVVPVQTETRGEHEACPLLSARLWKAWILPLKKLCTTKSSPGKFAGGRKRPPPWRELVNS
jgi:hypothetical protein